jgi:predicted short-subunit dehydrogenase-like oxidoreductase (DUF2520 family)
MINIAVAGYGNLGYHLVRVLQKENDIDLINIVSQKSFEIDNTLVVNTLDKINPKVDIIILCYPDNLLYNLELPYNKTIIHTSGATPLETLSSYSQDIGVFYPLMSFSKNYSVNWEKIPIIIQASNQKTENILLNLANKISHQVIKANNETRLAIHTSAVFANNFSTALFQMANKLLESKSIDFNILRPLIEETINRNMALSPENAITGPAFRKDYVTITKHLEFLKDYYELKDVYNILTDYIQTHFLNKNNNE